MFTALTGAEKLINFCDPEAHDIGESKNLGLVRQILIDGPGYSHQLEAYAEHQSTRAVAAYLRIHLSKPTTILTQGEI